MTHRVSVSVRSGLNARKRGDEVRERGGGKKKRLKKRRRKAISKVSQRQFAVCRYGLPKMANIRAVRELQIMHLLYDAWRSVIV